MAAGSTYTPIATTTLGSSAASYTFSSIPSTYTDLVLVIMAKNLTGDSDLALRFNGDTSSLYSSTYMYGTGSSAASTRGSNLTKVRAGRIDNVNAYPNIVNLQNYSNTTTNKTVVSRAQNGSFVLAYVGLWRSTAAIDSITILDDAGYTLASGSTFTLYGIAAA
jgi:hypothetical protein